MNYLGLLLRAKRLAQRPPSRRQIILFAIVVGVSLAIAGIEAFIGWPDWLTVDRGRLNP